MSSVPPELMEDVWSEMCDTYSKRQRRRSIPEKEQPVATIQDYTHEIVPSVPFTEEVHEAHQGSLWADASGEGSEILEGGSGKDLELAPSSLLPHEEMCVDDLQSFLENWEWNDCEGESAINEYQVRALVSYGTWLVASSRLDKVRKSL